MGYKHKITTWDRVKDQRHGTMILDNDFVQQHWTRTWGKNNGQQHATTTCHTDSG